MAAHLRQLPRITYHTALGLSAWLLLRNNFVEVTGVTGQSMAPTLSPNYDTAGERDRLLFNRFGPALRLRRGDIVSFRAPHDPEQMSIKRVVALPGDTVVTRGRYPFKKVPVPFNHVWVEGDNWRNTVDSNDFGPIPMALINGRAEYIVWPPRRVGKVAGRDAGFKTYSKVIPNDFEPQMPEEYAD